MEHLDLTTLADRAGVPIEAARRYRDAYVLFIPAIRVGRTIGFPVEAIDVLRLIADREADGDDPAAVQAALEAAYPVTVLSAQPIEPGTLASPQAAVLELLRGVDDRYAALAAQVAGLTETVASVSGTVSDGIDESTTRAMASVSGTVAELVDDSVTRAVASLSGTISERIADARPADELAELRTMLAAAQAAIDAASAASQAAAAGQQVSHTAVVDALAEQALHRTTDQATILRALDDLAAATAAGQDRTIAGHQALTTAQASLAAGTHAEHQALLTASASMVASTHAEHQALLTALDRQKGELAAMRGEQTRVRTELATIQHVVPTLATIEHVEWLGTGLTTLGQRVAAQIGEHLPTGSYREQMTAHVAAQTAEGVGTLLDARTAELTGHIDARLTALARHVEARVAQIDRRVSAIASIPSDAGPSQAALLERIAALTRQVADEGAIQQAALERIASERDEATRLMGQLVAEALATIQQEVRAGTAMAMAAQSAAQAAAHRAAQAAQTATAHTAYDAPPPLQLHSPSGQPIVATPPTEATRPAEPSYPAQRPSPTQTWTDHLLAVNGIAASVPPVGSGPGTRADEIPASGDPRDRDPATAYAPTANPAPPQRADPASSRSTPPAPVSSTPAASRTHVGATNGSDTGGSAAADAAHPGLPNRRRLGHPLKPGDLTQTG